MQCPWCLEHFHESWDYKFVVRVKAKSWGVGSTICAACGEVIFTLGQFIQLFARVGEQPQVSADLETFFRVYPPGTSRPPIPSEVPSEFATDYREACLVLEDSGKASAALSRRCLQHLLREKAGIKRDDLAKEIQQVLDSKQLPGYLADDLDAIRNIGNFAAHPMKAIHTGEILDVEPQEAEWLLNLLEGLFDFYFVQPKRAKAKREALNLKLGGAGKPPMKTS